MTIDENYQKTLDYLYSFVDFSMTRGARIAPDQFDLARMRDFLSALGNPEQAYPCLHIAGTKGKGSVSAMCASALRAGGYRVGLYTSPHLEDYAERIRVNGENIPHAEMARLVDEMKPAIESIPRLTTFEITTGLAFLYFARQGVEAAVFEVGLGGRLDATNVLLPAVTVITSLSYDHTYILGNTLAEIAGEKGGIIKPGVPLVAAPQQEEARLVLERISAERGAPLIQVGRDVLFRAGAHTLDGQELDVWREGQTAQRLFIPLLGSYQVENAAVAWAALEQFSQRALPVSPEAVLQGFAGVDWPGRFEVLRREPPVVVNSAHNRDSSRKLRQALDDYFPGREVVLIYGASEDKDIAGMFDELLPRVRLVVVTKSFHPRAIEPELLVKLAVKHDRPVMVVPEVVDALDEALAAAGDGAVVLATGSIFVAAGVRQAWREKNYHEKQ